MSRREKDLEYLNEIRARWGYPPVQEKERICIRCGGKFLSYGRGHRVCDVCHKNEASKG